MSQDMGGWEDQRLTDVDVEREALSAALNSPEAMAIALNLLTVHSFTVPAHRRMWETMVELSDSGFAVDPITLGSRLQDIGWLDEVGGYVYISQVSTCGGMPSNINTYIRVLEEKRAAREAVLMLRESTGSLRHGGDVQQVIEDAASKLHLLSAGIRSRDTAVKAPQLAEEALAAVRKAMAGEGAGIPSGFPRLDEHTSGWQDSDLITVAGRTAHGKCLTSSTTLRMFDGSVKRAGEVRPGDLLMGPDSKPRTVLSTCRGFGKMYRVDQRGGMSYGVNSDHILSVQCGWNEGAHRLGEVTNINIEEYLAKSAKYRRRHRGYRVPVEYPETPLSLDPYFLGIWLGDGYQDNPVICNPDPEIEAYLQEFAAKEGLEVHTHYDKRTGCPSHRIANARRSPVGGRSPSLLVKLRQLDLVHNKHIPEEYLVNSRRHRMSLLAGLLDSDGHLYAGWKSFEYCTVRPELAEQVRTLCQSLGFRVGWIAKTTKNQTAGFAGTAIVLTIYGPIWEIPCKVKRKQATPRQPSGRLPDNHLLMTLTITPTGNGEYVGFELDGDGLFLLEDFTVTHNTSVALDFSYAAAKAGHGVLFFSSEQKRVQIAMRMISKLCGVSLLVMRSPKCTPTDFERIQRGATELQGLPFWVDDSPYQTPQGIIARARRMQRQGVRLILVDYIQHLTWPERTHSREQEIARMVKYLKQGAKELNLPIISMAQLSRTLDLSNREPVLSDLRESASLEMESDLVLFIFRPEAVGITQMVGPSGESVSTENMGKLIIAKQRNGPLGSVVLRWAPTNASFEEDGQVPLPPAPPAPASAQWSQPPRREYATPEELPF